MKAIRFNVPVFRTGFNTTFRFGIQDFRLHELVQLCDSDMSPIHEAEIVSLYYGMMYSVPDVLIEAGHDEKCTDYFELRRVMQDMYPTFDDADDVTVIGFYLTDRKV